MVTFDADVTDPPSVSTSQPVGTLMDWAGYVLVVGLVFVALGISQNVIAPAVGGLMEQAGLSSGGTSDGTDLQLGA